MTDPRDDAPARPLCPECHTHTNVERYRSNQYPWYCAACNLVFTGSASGYDRHQAARAEAWAERQAPIPDQLRDLRERED